MKKGWAKCTCNLIAVKLLGSIREEAFREYVHWFCSELEVPPEHEDYPE